MSSEDWLKVAKEVVQKALKAGKIKDYMPLFEEKLSLTAMRDINFIITTNERFSDALNLETYKALRLGKLFNRINIAGFDADHKFVVHYELGRPSSLRALAVKTPESARRRFSMKAFGKTFIELLAAFMAFVHEKYIVKRYW